MENLPVIIAEVSVAPSGELFRNTFFLRMFQTFYRRFYQDTANHVMGSRADHDKSRYENSNTHYISVKYESSNYNGIIVAIVLI